jgi:hypothetical protein
MLITLATARDYHEPTLRSKCTRRLTWHGQIYRRSEPPLPRGLACLQKGSVTMSAQSTSGIAAFRRWLLRIHGAILTLVALGSAVATTIGWMTGTGPFGFMQHNPLVWVGLIQAYLLMTIIAVLLVPGSGQPNARKWNVVGALAHCVPLIAALSSLDVFESMGALAIVQVAIAFHLVWLCLETIAALYPDPSS